MHDFVFPFLPILYCKVLLSNDLPQMVPLNSLMINLPVKFIRGNFDYFRGRLNDVFYEEASAPQLFVLTILYK